MLSFVLVCVTADNHSLISVNEGANVVPMFMAIWFEFCVPIEENEKYTVLAYLYDGFDHARHYFVLKGRKLTKNT